MKFSNLFSSEELTVVANEEGVKRASLKRRLDQQTNVILAGNRHKGVHPVGVGKGLTIKINANIGTSPSNQHTSLEMQKLALCEKHKVDTIMDLSLGNKSKELRQAIITKTRLPVGTVPLYECFYQNKDKPEDMFKSFMRILEQHGEDGVDFAVIHAGLLRRHLDLVKSRIIKVTSRGGSLMMKWMQKHQRENFLFEHFDEILDLCRHYRMTISLGDGMRPATVIDETDEAQLEELRNLGELVLRCREAGVQSMVEGPGHIPFHKIALNIKLQKKFCHGAPFYVLGPLVTDVAPGYDHITSAIGATLAASSGADFLCYVTPSEHLSLPDLADVKEGIMAFRIAAHAVNITRGKGIELDRMVSQARAKVDWKEQRKYVLDPEKFDAYLARAPQDIETCTMCGEFCALK